MMNIAAYTVETQQAGLRRTVVAVIPTACDYGFCGLSSQSTFTMTHLPLNFAMCR